MTISFTYFQREDRLLVVLQPGDHKLWLTRYLTQSILRDIATLFASVVPGDGIPGTGSAAERIMLEHRMAMDEEDLADQPSQGNSMQFSKEPPARPEDGDISLCTGLDAKAGADYGSLTFNVGEQHLTLRYTRAGFHRFLRTLMLCASKANWQIESIPDWLRQSLLKDLLGNLPPLDEADDAHHD